MSIDGADKLTKKRELWAGFASKHHLSDSAVPLFDTDGDIVKTIPYGRNGRPVLKRSPEMEQLMRRLGRHLISEYRQSNVTHDGILYMMLRPLNGTIVPLYIGKAEVFGRGKHNLSANIGDLDKGQGKFGRWGYNYAYHIGDLSAVTLDPHPDEKKTNKYSNWRDALFVAQRGRVKLRSEVSFWATLWGPDSQSIWQEYGKTKLAFEEYLLIGVASDIFPEHLLNQEGRTRDDY